MDHTTASHVNYNAWGHIDAGSKFYILNNVWGLTSSEQALCRHISWYDKDTVSAGWHIDIPESLFIPSKVRSYMQMYVGQKDPNLPTIPVESLPAKLGDLETFITDFNIQIVKATSPFSANIAAEVFLHSQPAPVIDPDPAVDTRTFELMVWTSVPEPASTISLGVPVEMTAEYQVYVDSTRTIPYMAVVANDPSNPGINIDWLTLFKLASTHFPDIDFGNQYVTSVEGGTEAWAGTYDFEVLAFNTVVVRKDGESGDTGGTGGAGGIDHRELCYLNGKVLVMQHSLESTLNSLCSVLGDTDTRNASPDVKAMVLALSRWAAKPEELAPQLYELGNDLDKLIMQSIENHVNKKQ